MRSFAPIPESVENFAEEIVHACYEIHITLGPGLLESVYEGALFLELTERGMPFRRQHSLPVRYKGKFIPLGLRLDFWIDGCLIVELKTVERILPIHKAQLLTYLRLTNNRLGLLVNFNAPTIKDGIRRMVL